MKLVEAIQIAGAALLAHKLRTLLTLLGMVIGVGSVVGMLALGNGYSAYVRAEFDRLGVGALYLDPRVDSSDPAVTLSPRLTAADGAAIGERLAAQLAAVGWEYRAPALLSAGDERLRYTVTGATASMFELVETDLGAGRLFSSEEERRGARVAVLGTAVAQQFFGSSQLALGQTLLINGVRFRVVGVTTTRPNPMTGALGAYIDPSEQVIVPYRTAVERLFRGALTEQVDVSRVVVQARDAAGARQLVVPVRELLRERQRMAADDPDPFTITDLEQLAQEYSAVTIGISAFLGLIGGISLLVGGIGIMNMMLVSVVQRTREIGLRKALGACQRDIALQFLIEALVIGLIGGALGIALGFGLAQLGNLVFAVALQAGHIRSIVTPGSLLLAAGLSAGIGVVFGLVPALRAARLHPIEALR